MEIKADILIFTLKMKSLKCPVQTEERSPQSCTSKYRAKLGSCLEQEKLLESPLRKVEQNVAEKFRSNKSMTENSIFKL